MSSREEKISTKLPELNEARALNQAYFSEVRGRIEQWLGEQEQLCAGEVEVQALAPAARDAVELAIAIFSARYGAGSRRQGGDFPGYEPLDYHNTSHAYDLMVRLARIFAAYPAEFPFSRRIMLALFALCHDLRQSPGLAIGDAVGGNERGSAAEAEAILERCFASILSPTELERWRQHMRLMIFGTTFAFVPMQKRFKHLRSGEDQEVSTPVGALAPMLVAQLEDGSPDDIDRQLCENILLAADVDTANVSDRFDAFARQGIDLCREIERRKGRFEEGAADVYGFMTGGQEYYFNLAQRYNSRFAKELLSDEKNANGQRLVRLTRRIRDRFGDPAEELKKPKAGVSAEAIFQAYIQGARELAAESDGPDLSQG